MSEKTFAYRMKQFDAYPKVLEDFRVKTFSGAIVTTMSSFIMCVLFISEFRYYLYIDVHPELLVDTTRPEKLRINIDVFFPMLGCAYLSIDAMDVSGAQITDIEHSIFKRRYDKQGKPIDNDAMKEDLLVKNDEIPNLLNTTEDTRLSLCKSCYGAETEEQPCCETCEDVRKAYRSKGWTIDDPDGVSQCKLEHSKEKFKEQSDEGCQIYGYLEVSKVAGKFHIAPDKRFQQQPHVLFQFVNIGKDGQISMNFDDLLGLGTKKYNVSHHIRSLSFGVPIPGVENPLDGTNVSSMSESMMHQYFVKIVPTVYTKLSGEMIRSNQYSFTKQMRHVGGMAGEHGPGLFVRYELSPLLIQYTEKRRSFMRFLTGVCAIIGGVFTVAGLIDSMIYRSAKAIKKNIEVGKST